eukprot:356274-Chlamydomonas_euryale.AAC.8
MAPSRAHTGHPPRWPPTLPPFYFRHNANENTHGACSMRAGGVAARWRRNVGNETDREAPPHKLTLLPKATCTAAVSTAHDALSARTRTGVPQRTLRIHHRRKVRSPLAAAAAASGRPAPRH